MEIFLVNVSYKRVIYTKFLELFLCLHFLKNNQTKIMFLPKRHILGWQILLPLMFFWISIFFYLKSFFTFLPWLQYKRVSIKISLLGGLLRLCPLPGYLYTFSKLAGEEKDSLRLFLDYEPYLRYLVRVGTSLQVQISLAPNSKCNQAGPYGVFPGHTPLPYPLF